MSLETSSLIFLKDFRMMKAITIDHHITIQEKK